MSDLFPGFAEHRLQGDGAEIYCRTGGEGPPLLLLHGFPESHMMWSKMASALAEHFVLVIPDLRGYGRSSKPANTADNEPYSKRRMGRDFFAVMSGLGHERFMVCGHDRGGRCAYRMALDEPDRILKLAVLDIIPTWDMWKGMNHTMAMKTYHWPFLAQPYPLPETLIGHCADFYLETKLGSWNGRPDLSAFDPVALADYKTHFADPATLHALCNDYRAGETYDLAADDADRQAGRKIACPTLALWGTAGIPAESDAPLKNWQAWCENVTGGPVESGHFLPEENPQATLEQLLPFLMKP